MRLLIQRVSRASVSIDGIIKSQIGGGLLVLVGIGNDDAADDIDWLVGKVAGLRIFDDLSGVMNLDIRQVDGDALVISQFTLHASTRKGNRPSYIKAAGESVARPLYEEFIARLSQALGKSVGTGEFGADMQVELLNNGPVTIWIDSKNRE